MTQVVAARELIDCTRGPERERLAVAVGVDVFGDGKLDRLTRCAVCGVLGDVGDDCGRRPIGHKLVAS